MKLSECALRNPLIVNVLAVFLLVMGLLALTQIERESFPNVSFDIVEVTTEYPGAASAAIEKRITIPIEKELRKVADIERVESYSMEGASRIYLRLEPDAPDKARVINDIQKAVDRTRDLPADLARDPQVREMDSRDTPLVEVSLSGALTDQELRTAARQLEDELRDLPGIAAVGRKGLRDREIWVEVLPEQMAALEVSLDQVIERLRERNINVPGGVLRGAADEQMLRTNGEFAAAADIGNVVLRANEEGGGIRIAQIARVHERLAEESTVLRTDGTRAINLLLVKKDKADAIRLMDDLQVALRAFAERSHPALRIALVNDFSYYVKRRLGVLIQNGWIGLVLVFIPLMLFLSPRVALGAAFGMPVAILTAIAAMQWLGISINLISMFGLIMVLGMLVDEDVVIAENIARHLEEGWTPREAAAQGAAEVTRAILSTVATTIIAFLPLLFMTGIFGKFLSDIPKVVMITLGASLIEALIILPSHLVGLNHSVNGTRKFEKQRQHRVYDRVRALYARLLRRCLAHRWITIGVTLAVTAAGFTYGAVGMRFVLFPTGGVEAFFVRAEAPRGTRLEETERRVHVLEAIVRALPPNELDHYVTEVGIIQNDPNDPFGTTATHVAQIRVFLKPGTEHERTAEQIMDDLRQRANTVEGFDRVSYDPVKHGPPVGKPIAVRIRGEDFATLEALAARYEAALQAIPGVTDVRTDLDRGKDEMQVVIDETRAHQARLAFDGIAQTVRQAFAGVTVTSIREADEEIDVVVRLPEELRADLAAVHGLLLRNREGRLVPLREVATLRPAVARGDIRHRDGKRVVTVTANLREHTTTAQAVNRALRQQFAELPRNHPGYLFDYGGEEEETDESLTSLFHAFIAALFLIFLVLLITFGSLTQTLVLLLTIPFGLVGVILGLTLSGLPLSFLALLGVVGLTGVVVDSGTLFFTFANQLRAAGKPLHEALLEACEVRLRPVLLTTVTTIGGVMPAAYGIGGSDPFIQPMAIAMNWGLLVSMFFTLFAIPVIYLTAEEWLAHARTWRWWPRRAV